MANYFGHLDALSRALENQRSKDKVINPLSGVKMPKNFVVREYTDNFRYVLVYHIPMKSDKWVSVAEIKKEGMAEAYYDTPASFLPVSKMKQD